MERLKAIIPAGSSSGGVIASQPEADSMISILLYDVSQQVEMGLQNMLKRTSEIDQSAADIGEDIEKCKESASETSKILEEEKERFQKLAISVIEMLNGGGFN